LGAINGHDLHRIFPAHLPAFFTAVLHSHSFNGYRGAQPTAASRPFCPNLSVLPGTNVEPGHRLQSCRARFSNRHFGETCAAYRLSQNLSRMHIRCRRKWRGGIAAVVGRVEKIFFAGNPSIVCGRSNRELPPRRGYFDRVSRKGSCHRVYDPDERPGRSEVANKQASCLRRC
jgi:hypothetical protein